MVKKHIEKQAKTWIETYIIIPNLNHEIILTIPDKETKQKVKRKLTKYWTQPQRNKSKIMMLMDRYIKRKQDKKMKQKILKMMECL
jgi:hypothetical protein